MSLFDLNKQNNSIDFKIVAGLERLSQVFRILLWEKAREYGLSPIQIQVLIFIHYHAQNKSTISYLAQEFNLTKPTISDAVKVLEQKKLIKKETDTTDTRSYTVQLTNQGKKIVLETEDFTSPVTDFIEKTNENDKLVLWDTISSLIASLNKIGIINVQRTCFSCKHYTEKGKTHFCSLLGQKILTQDIRIDCAEFENMA